MNTIGENSKINTYSVSNENTVVASNAKTENKVGLDDTAAILSLSEEAFGDGVVTVKSTAAVRSASYSEIIAAQNQLRTLGFYSGGNTGYISTDMATSITHFQKVYGLAETGTLNTTTLNKLSAAYNDYNEIYTSDAMQTLASSLYHQGNQSDTFAKVYTFLKNSMGLNTAQIAGVMGNMHAESGIIADNANNNYYPGEHNPEYAAVYDKEDNIAFGLIQWYDHSRKEGLLNMAKEMCGQTNATTITSEIADALNDVNVQLAYFRKEMTQVSPYKEAWQQIKNTYSYASVSDVFLEEIEKPTNCSELYEERRQISATIYNALLTL